MKRRLFLGLEIDPDFQNIIFSAVAALKSKTTSFRWVQKENLHLTIRFLGGIEESKIDKIREVLAGPMASFTPFSIGFSELGGFPNLKKCRVLWIGVEKGNEACLQLKKISDDSLIRFGFPKEPENFIPHVTLARSKTNGEVFLDLLDRQIFTEMKKSQILIKKMTLFQSELKPSGALHTNLFDLHFKAA